MKLKTEVKIPEYDFKICFKHKIFFIGSCFSDNIGKKFADYFFKTLNNPFGTLFNPYSIGKNLLRVIDGKPYTEDELRNWNGKWFSFDHYTKFSSSSKTETLEKINQSLNQSRDFLKNADFLFITFGTARVYKFLETKQIVANCHKLPAKLFEKQLLEPDFILEHYKKVLEKLLDLNSSLKIIFTISPVRHWNDGAFGNNVNKAVLFVALDKMLKKYPVYYFPSYEIVMDELRDYRFYAEDMLHLSPVAVDYIWEKIQKSLINVDTIKIFPRIEKIIKALNHKPQDALSAEYVKFLENTLKQITALEKENPFINLSQAKEQILNSLKQIS